MSQFSRRTFAASAVAAIAAPQAFARASRKEAIVFGGPIYTGKGADGGRVEALLVHDGKIMFAGPLANARRAKPRAQEIDLKGAAAFPGFIDAHVHLTEIGLLAMQLDLVGVPSLAAMQKAIADYARTHPTGPILGGRWIETHWPERRFPTRADMDAVVKDRPLWLSRADGHAAVANSAALALAKIDATTRDPAGGQILRDAKGVPTGMLIDNAQSLVDSKLPPPSRATKRAALAQAVKLYASRGWTGAGFMSATEDDIANLDALATAGALPFPIDVYLDVDQADSVFKRGPYSVGGGLVRVRGVKIYMDGALGSRGAALLAPYSDAPGSGLLRTPIEDIRKLTKRARAAKIQVATHAIGDRGNRLVLDAYRDAFADAPDALRAARWRIEHAQIVAREDMPRFGRMGVIASMQASHCIGDMFFAPARLGVDRLNEGYAWKSILGGGAVLAGGTDAPVEKGDPLIEFYAAAYRHALNGFATPDWHPEEALSRAEALRMYTWGGAYASFREGERATLEPGMRADLSVFDTDLMTAPFPAIAKARAKMTIVGGKVVYAA